MLKNIIKFLLRFTPNAIKYRRITKKLDVNLVNLLKDCGYNFDDISGIKYHIKQTEYHISDGLEILNSTDSEFKIVIPHKSNIDKFVITKYHIGYTFSIYNSKMSSLLSLYDGIYDGETYPLPLHSFYPIGTKLERLITCGKIILFEPYLVDKYFSEYRDSKLDEILKESSW